MKDEKKTKEQLINELEQFRNKLARFEPSASGPHDARDAHDFERRQLLSIMDSIDEPVYISDPETYELLYMNRALRELFGNVLGQKCHIALQKLAQPCDFCTNDRIFGENAGRPYIWEYQNKANKRWYHCIDKAIRWPGDRMVRYEMAIDITDGKRSEEALREQTALSQLLLDALPCLALLVRMPNHEVMASNKAGRDAGAVPGKQCFATWGQRDDLCPWCLAPTALAKGEPQHLQVDALDIVWDAHWYPMGGDLYLHYAFDITEKVRAEEERRKLEAQIQHAQKFESMGVLAGGVAHDFNNLLTSILGNASLARKELSPASPARESLEEIETASQRAAELCRQMLAYAGKGKFVIEPVGLNELVEEMAHLLEVSISKKAVLKYDFTDNLPAVEADATQIRQVIMNLITNASEALGEESGTIKIATGIKKCTREFLRGIYLGKELPEGEYFCLEVADTGCGMDEETLAKMFDPFFTTKFTGRGLGLAAALGIVRGHKGAIRVSSKPGRGTTFKIFFPASDRLAKPAEKEFAAVEQGWTGSGTILLVDDERGIRRLGKRILEDFGFAVLVAANGREAVRMFQEHKNEIVLVLLDLTMPKMSGDEAFQEIRQIKSDARVILSSGYMEEDAVVRFAGRGLAGFLQKPYNSQVLEKKIREILGD